MGIKVSSVKEYFDTLSQRFQVSGAKGVNAVFQFELSGDNGGTYNVIVNESTFEVAQGAHTAPSFTLKMKDEDFIKMSNGELRGEMAFMTGKMKVSGNIQLARKMQTIFPPG
jgi:putative sterol carrier protein